MAACGSNTGGTGGGSGGSTGGGTGGSGGGSTGSTCTFSTPQLINTQTGTVITGAGRTGEAFVAWQEQDTSVSGVWHYSNHVWAAPFMGPADGGSSGVGLVVGDNGEAHALLGVSSEYFFAPPGGSFTKPSSRPARLPYVTPYGDVAVYEDDLRFDRIDFQRRTDAGDWPAPTVIVSDGGDVRLDSVFVDATGEVDVSWSISDYTTVVPIEHEWRATVSVTGTVTAPQLIWQSPSGTGLLRVSQNHAGDQLVTWAPADQKSFQTARVSRAGQVSDQKMWAGSLVSEGLADDGSASVAYTPSSNTFLQTWSHQSGPDAGWTETNLPKLVDAGPTDSWGTYTLVGPTGDGYQVDSRSLTDLKFRVAHLTPTGAQGPVHGVDINLGNSGAPFPILGANGQLVFSAQGIAPDGGTETWATVCE
jgi:hypothetical protein